MDSNVINYVLAKKTNEKEMFLGSASKLNKLVEPLTKY